VKRSETISEIAKALTKFNSEVTKIAKNADNPFFKSSYSTLDHIIEEIRPILTKNGLSILQIPSGDGQNVIMKTLLIHESGEFLESDELIMKPAKNDPQGIGSTISYSRRYSLCSFLSLSTGEQDDDGNEATFGGKKPQQKQTQQTQQKPPVSDHYQPKLISQNQLKLLKTLIGKMEKAYSITSDEVKAMLEKTNGVGPFASSKDLTVGQASAAIKALQTQLGEG
jgi:hypothetical protein